MQYQDQTYHGDGVSFVVMWIRAAVVLGVSILLMGSKLVIVVPDGGAVVSSSGLVTCSARETCTVDTSEYPFAETFTAVAEPGYEFTAWGDGASAVCAGGQNPDCSELDHDAFSSIPDSGALNDSAGTLTLRPGFSAQEPKEAGPAPRISVSSYHRTRNYLINGNTREEVWQQLHGNSNPLVMDHKTGRKPTGYTRVGFKYLYQGAYEPNGSSCNVASGNFEFSFETVLPYLAMTDETDEALKVRWKHFHTEIVEHEARHIALYRQLLTQLPETLLEISGVPCSELRSRVRMAIENAVDVVKESNHDYDRNEERNVYIASLLNFRPTRGVVLSREQR